MKSARFPFNPHSGAPALQKDKQFMKLKKLFLIALLVLASWLPRQGFGQTTATDGDWLASVVILSNTPEAQLMVRVGDIDNLGFGWPTSFDPFSGNDTPGHGFPWAPKPADYSGTDRIMVVSSFNGNPPAGSDGYSGTTRPDNNPRPIVLQYPATGIQIVNAALQIFVDDFQAPVWGAKYQVTLNGKRYPELEVVINSLVQTGPIGKLITVPVSPSLLPEVASGQIALLFDDPTTGAGDGYAIDFVKLLINLKGNLQSGTISGHVSEEGTGRSLAGATVSAFDQTVQTDANGDYRLANVPAGLAFVTASSPGYQTGSTTTDVRAGQTSAGVNFQLQRLPLTVAIYTAVELEFFAHVGTRYVLQYSADLQNWNDVEQIKGAGTLVNRLRATRPAAQRYWRVAQKP